MDTLRMATAPYGAHALEGHAVQEFHKDMRDGRGTTPHAAGLQHQCIAGRQVEDKAAAAASARLVRERAVLRLRELAGDR